MAKLRSQMKTGPKVVLVLAVLVGIVFGARHFIMKNGGGEQLSQKVAAATGTEAPAPTGELGTPGHPLKVSIVSFHGYAPGLLANGKSLKTAPGSIYGNLGTDVEFVIQDDVPTLTTIFGSGTAHCAWRTSDFWAQEQPNLINSGYDGRAVLLVDNTQGGDAIVATDPSIKSVEDLAGHKVALLQYTPSHGMLIDAVQNSSLSAKRRQTINTIFVEASEGTGGVRAALEGKHVDAAVLWDPDLSLAVKSGAHVVYSTKNATNLIYDLMVCDKRVLDNPANTETIQNFVTGWFKGIDAAEANRDEALDALVKTEAMFADLVKTHGAPFVKETFTNLDFTGLDDNARVLGLTPGGTNQYANLYRKFDEIYRGIGSLANPKSPVVDPADSFDTRYVESLLKATPAAVAAAQKPQFTFSEAAREKAASTTPAVTKPVLVSFPTGSAVLSARAKKTIDDEMVPLIEANGSAYFRISGNTDSTGDKAANQRLSKARADATVEYLVKEWEFEPSRFDVVGNGSTSPICNEKHPEADDLTLAQCREQNRATRAAVLR